MMNRRNVLLVASAAIGVGLVLIIASLSLMGFDVRKLGAGETRTDSYEFTESFTRIEISALSGDVRFARSSDGKTHIESAHGDGIHEEAAVENGVLKLKQSGEGGVRFFVWNFGEDETLTVYLPQSAYDALTVSTASGDVDVPGEFSFTDAAIATASGDVRFLAHCANALTASTVSGDIEADGVEPDSLKVSTTSGKVVLTDVRAAGNLEIHTISGDVELDRCDAGAIDIKTTSGEVEGTLLTGKTFDVHTTSGSVRVPADTAGAPRCTINTTSGDVELRID